jgi:DNA-nicking Smr family endonuclease
MSPAVPAPPEPDKNRTSDGPLELPIDGVLDLHTFKPSAIKELIPDYLAACQAKGILEVRIIHGKGTGQLRAGVHAVLARLPAVNSFALASEAFGGWGATIVHLRRPT